MTVRQFLALVTAIARTESTHSHAFATMVSTGHTVILACPIISERIATTVSVCTEHAMKEFLETAAVFALQIGKALSAMLANHLSLGPSVILARSVCTVSARTVC